MLCKPKSTIFKTQIVFVTKSTDGLSGWLEDFILRWIYFLVVMASSSGHMHQSCMHFSPNEFNQVDNCLLI